MKTLIYQVSVSEGQSVYEPCIASVEQYCNKYNIDHIVQREPILKIVSSHPQRKGAIDRHGYLPIYEKENAFNYLDQYDKICIVDSDIYIRDTAPNIFDEIDMDTAFAGVRECDMPLTAQYYRKITGFSVKQYEAFPHIMKEKGKYGIPFYNMGLMLFTSKLAEHLDGQTPREFIQRNEFKGFVDGLGHWKWSTDQTLLNYWVKTTQMPTKNLEWKWNALYKGVRDEVVSEAYFIHFFLSSKLPKRGAEIPSIVKHL
jgi:alpha-N-acetylglucosamine transferase